jgi:hypothetical protein
LGPRRPVSREEALGFFNEAFGDGVLLFFRLPIQGLSLSLTFYGALVLCVVFDWMDPLGEGPVTSSCIVSSASLWLIFLKDLLINYKNIHRPSL